MKNGSIKRWFISLLGLSFLLTACGPKEIPDNDMQDIIHDIFLVNAYYMLYQQSHMSLDSIDIYTPILEKYGYDTEDFRYSMDRMALKKSSRLAELIDKATADIKAENDYYEGRERIVLRVDTLIGRYYRDTIYMRPDSVWIRDLKNRDTLKLTFPIQHGRYRILYGYFRDTTDQKVLSMRFRVKDTTGNIIYNNSRTLVQGDKYRKIDINLDAAPDADSLLLILADYSAAAKKAALRIDSLYLIYDAPLDSLRLRYWKDQLGRYARKTYPPVYESNPQDSCTLHLMPPLRPDSTGCAEL